MNASTRQQCTHSCFLILVLQWDRSFRSLNLGAGTGQRDRDDLRISESTVTRERLGVSTRDHTLISSSGSPVCSWRNWSVHRHVRYLQL